MPNISIVLPVFNGSQYLRNAVESILNQTISDFELIIVDDCSTDDSGKIACEFVRLDPRVIYIKNQENLKLPASLNKGFSYAKGKYWTWTSCDNLYLPTALEILLATIVKNDNIGLVYSSMELINESNEVIGLVKAGKPQDLIFKNVVGGCFLYRKTIANKIGSYDNKLFLCEDYEYWLRIARVSLLRPIPNILYKYRQHKNSLSTIHEKKVIDLGIKIQKSHYSSFIKTREQAALFYAQLRARDIYNPFRHFYMVKVFFYSPIVFSEELYKIALRKFLKIKNCSGG